MIAISVVAALGAAALFGFSSVLMARSARAEPADEVLRFRLLARLLRSRAWLLGAVLQPISFAVQALALSLGPLALVQPLAATDLLFALPFQARLVSRRRTGRLEWFGGLLVAGGIAAFLTISPPGSGLGVPTTGGWLAIGAVTGGGAVVAALVALRTQGTARTTWLAAAGAITFALVDVLSKASVDTLRADGPGGLLVTWYPYALIVVGILGLLLSQSAFQSGPLQVSLPVIDTVEPTLAVLAGAVVFREALATSPGALAAQLLAGVIALFGIVVLDRSVA